MKPVDYFIKRTKWSNDDYNETISIYEEAVNDIHKEYRLKVHQCKYCYYILDDCEGGSRVPDNISKRLGARNCLVCDKQVCYEHDKICDECADKYSLCITCCGDID
ncbi:MAG: hypothetical protein JRN15_11495, partial [Nitrososphaerota archaeon]|nr:hypothetical protein [Nitrososphaerota archaeon]